MINFEKLTENEEELGYFFSICNRVQGLSA